MREAIAGHLEHFGVAIDRGANERHEPLISPPDMRPQVWVVPTDEEAMIAEHAGVLVYR